MKFYRIDWRGDGVTYVEWYTSEVQAKRANTGLKKLRLTGVITAVDVPTSKAELVEWLNKNVRASQ